MLNSLFVLSRHPATSACALVAAAATVGLSSLTGSTAKRDLALVSCILVIAITCARVRFVLPRVYRAHARSDEHAEEERAPAPLGSPARAADAALELLPDDLLLRVCACLPLADLAALAQCSRHTAFLAKRPELWRVLNLPERAESIRTAIAAIPSCLEGPVEISLQAGVFVEGRRPRWRELCGLDGARCGGVKVTRQLIIKARAGDAGRVTIESDAGEAVAFLPGCEGSTLEGVAVRTRSFASHAVAVYADGVSVRECTLRACGRNSCGVVLTGQGVCARVERCDIAECGGGGVLISFGVGLVSIDECSIRRNTWSGVGAFSGASVRIARTELTGNKMFAVGCARDVALEVTEPCVFADNELGNVHRYLSSEPAPGPGST